MSSKHVNNGRDASWGSDDHLAYVWADMEWGYLDVLPTISDSTWVIVGR